MMAIVLLHHLCAHRSPIATFNLNNHRISNEQHHCLSRYVQRGQSHVIAEGASEPHFEDLIELLYHDHPPPGVSRLVL